MVYIFNIDREDPTRGFDNVPDVQVVARLAKDPGGACGLQLEGVPGAGGTFSGPIEEVFTSPSGMRAFAGLRNDPFFFDAEGYAALVASFATPGQAGDVVGAFRLTAAEGGPGISPGAVAPKVQAVAAEAIGKASRLPARASPRRLSQKN